MGTNRVVLGNLSTEHGRGLYISQNADNILSITKPMEFHSKMAASLQVFYYDEGIITAPDFLSSNSVDITHNWGTTGSHGTNDRPLFAVRWSYPSDIVNGVATACYPPNFYESEIQVTECEDDEEEEENCEDFSGYITEGCQVQHQSNNVIRIYNEMGVHSDDIDGDTTGSTKALYYAIVVFYEHDWTKGEGL